MKKFVSMAVLGAFLAAANVGCGDSKPAAKPADTKPASDKPGTGERVPTQPK
jgi:hypothetical protein